MDARSQAIGSQVSQEQAFGDSSKGPSLEDQVTFAELVPFENSNASEQRWSNSFIASGVGEKIFGTATVTLAGL